jgi:hypothetical protein
MPWRNLAVAAAAAASLTCHQAIMTAPPGTELTMFANPTFIPANGGVSVISALLIEPAGTPVPDGTVIQCFTSLGRVPEQSKTNDGVARMNLVSDSRSGTARVTCVSGAPAAPAPAPSASPTIAPGPNPGGSGTGFVDVIIGGALPATVVVTADPNPIQPDGPRESVISAFVTDAATNPVANVQVVFSFLDPPTTERLEGEGQPKFTDNNGRVQDVLRTQDPPGGAPRPVTIVATVLGAGTSGQVVVNIN